MTTAVDITWEILRIAQIAADFAVAAGSPMASSAQLRAADALTRYQAGDRRTCRDAAIGSLRYSQGVFGADYRRALTMSRQPCDCEPVDGACTSACSSAYAIDD